MISIIDFSLQNLGNHENPSSTEVSRDISSMNKCSNCGGGCPMYMATCVEKIKKSSLESNYENSYDND